MATTKTETPWGRAELVEELTVRQQAGDRRFASVVQLLETERGERLVRFAYSTDGVARRLDERGEDQRAVRGAEQRVDCVLGMRHEAHDVARPVAHARDVVDGAVALLAVAQEDLRGVEPVRRHVPAVAVLHRDDERLPGGAARREPRVIA